MDPIDMESQPKAENPLAGKIFFAVFFLLVVGSIAFTYWKVMAKRDFAIVAQADCDPYLENCFVHVCNPDPAVDGECVGDPAEDTWYTKNISRMAYNIPDCDPATDETCTALICDAGDKDCSYELCSASNVPEGDSCNDPVEYAKNNPAEEDEEDSVDIDSESDDADMIDENSSLDMNDFPVDDNVVSTEPIKEDDTSIVAPSDCNSPDSQSCSIPIVPSTVVQ